MTTSTSPHNPSAQMRQPLRISDPADLLAAVPALLGFVPEQSLVLICLGGRSGKSLGAVMRHDLVVADADADADPGELAPPMLAAIEQFGLVCRRDKPRAAIAVLIDDCANGLGAHEDIVETLGECLAEAGTELIAAHVTRAIVAGERWWSLLGDSRRGCVADPSASSVAAAHVLEGRQIRTSRGELAGLLKSGDLREVRTVAEYLDATTDSAILDLVLATRTTDPLAASRRDLERVLWQISMHASGERLLAPEIAELGVALTVLAVRDAVLGLAVGDLASDAEQLWLLLTQLLPDPYRAEAATLLGYFAYVRGDGPFAGVALTAALESNPDHRLANMLDMALQAGMRPESMRTVADAGIDCARDLGVTLPPPIRW